GETPRIRQPIRELHHTNPQLRGLVDLRELRQRRRPTGVLRESRMRDQRRSQDNDEPRAHVHAIPYVWFEFDRKDSHRRGQPPRPYETADRTIDPASRSGVYTLFVCLIVERT